MLEPRLEPIVQVSLQISSPSMDAGWKTHAKIMPGTRRTGFLASRFID